MILDSRLEWVWSSAGGFGFASEWRADSGKAVKATSAPWPCLVLLEGPKNTEFDPNEDLWVVFIKVGQCEPVPAWHPCLGCLGPCPH